MKNVGTATKINGADGRPDDTASGAADGGPGGPPGAVTVFHPWLFHVKLLSSPTDRRARAGFGLIRTTS
jgi:hypothetical protein